LRASLEKPKVKRRADSSRVTSRDRLEPRSEQCIKKKKISQKVCLEGEVTKIGGRIYLFSGPQTKNPPELEKGGDRGPR